MNVKQQKIYDDLIEVAKNYNCHVISEEYEGVKKNMEFLCPQLHKRSTTALRFKKNPTGCLKCPKNKSPKIARKNFIKNIQLLEGEY